MGVVVAVFLRGRPPVQKEDAAAAEPIESAPSYSVTAADAVLVESVRSSNREPLPRVGNGGVEGSVAGDSADDGGPARSIVVELVGNKGVALPHVALHVKRGMSTEEIGVSDAGGELVVTAKVIEGAGLFTMSRGFSRRVYEVPEEVGSGRYTLQLEQSAFISGRIELPNGDVPGTKVRVFAVSAGYDTRGASSFWHRGALGFSAEADLTGRFELEGLRPGKIYSIYAGGNGLVSPKPTRAISGAGEEAIIPVGFVFGALVRFRAEDGTVPRTLRYRAREQKNEETSWSVGKAIYRTSRLAALSGVSRDLAFSENPSVILFLVESLEKGQLAGPAEYHARPFGFDVVGERLWLGWLGEGLPVYDLPLRGGGSEQGEVLVELQGGDDIVCGYRSPECTMSEATLLLQQVGPVSSGEQIEVPLRGLFDGDGFCKVGGIPFGRYVASIQFGAGSHRFPEYGIEGVNLDVGNKVAKILVPLKGLGTVEAVLETEHGELYRGPAVFVLGEGEPVEIEGADLERFGNSSVPGRPVYSIASGRGTIRFECAPYVFPSLRPNKYHITAKIPRLTGDGLSDGLPPSVVVEPGAHERVTVRVRSEM